MRAFTSPIARPRDRRADVRELPGDGAAARASGRRRSRSTRRSGSTSNGMMPRPRRAPASSSSTTRTTRPRPCTAPRRSTDFVERVRAGIARHGDPDRRGVSRLRDRSVVRDARCRSRCRRRTSSSRGRSRRRTAWPACASATRSGRRDTMKPLAQLKMPYNVSVFGVAAAIAALDDTEAHRRRSARATPRSATFTVKALEDLGCKSQRLAGQLPLRRRRPAGEGVPRRLRQAGRRWSAATSRRSRRPTRASRSARWKR